jgi:hypothetical protein
MAMKMLYRKCWKCGETKDVFPYSGDCVQCYQKDYYHGQKVKLAAVSPSTALGYITGTLKGVELLRDCGLFTQLKCAAWQEDLLEAHTKLQAEINSNEQTQALIDAQIEEVQEVVKFELSTGAIEAESPEEAEKVFQARAAELRRQVQEWEQQQQAMLEERKRAGEKLAEAASKARERAAEEKHRFTTGEKPVEEQEKAAEEKKVA